MNTSTALSSGGCIAAVCSDAFTEFSESARVAISLSPFKQYSLHYAMVLDDFSVKTMTVPFMRENVPFALDKNCYEMQVTCYHQAPLVLLEADVPMFVINVHSPQTTMTVDLVISMDHDRIPHCRGG